MDKVCKDCNSKLVIGDNWTEGRRKAWVYFCKSCARQRGKKHYEANREQYHASNRAYNQSKKDGLHHVYIVDNYAGYTQNTWRRKVSHKQAGRNTDTFRVIYSTKNRDEALELEALLHDIGYEGKHEGGFTHHFKNSDKHPRWHK